MTRRSILLLGTCVLAMWIAANQCVVVGQEESQTEEDIPVYIEYIHGGMHSGLRDSDKDVARAFGEALTGDPESAIAIDIDLCAGVDIPLPSRLIPILKINTGTGCLKKSDLAEEQWYDLETRVTNESHVIKIGFSSGGGTVIDMVMNRHVDADTMASWQALLDEYANREIHLSVVGLDSFLGVHAITDQDIAELEGFLAAPNHDVLLVNYGGFEINPVGWWLCEDRYQEIVTLTQESNIASERLVLIDKTTDTGSFWEAGNPLADIAHASNPKDIAPFVAAAIRQSYRRAT